MISSLTIFFPCYNDAGTIASMVVAADMVARELTDDYEIIVVDDASTDHSRKILNELKIKYNKLRLIFHTQNLGYGGALRSGFKNATKDLIFYTDGDAQYDIAELKKLWSCMDDDVDVVNGFKIKRLDPFYRVAIGKIYQYVIKTVFLLKIKDIDCDFRLMRKKIFENIELKQNSGAICIEMIKKIQNAGYKFKEAGVNHFFRAYGRSQFFNFKRIMAAIQNLFALWIELVVLKKGVPCDGEVR
jgi:glycosyltransferase involved in cell wall biosynthesis